jgi:hypothetical protein
MNGKEKLDDLLRTWPAPAPGTAKGVIKADDGGHWEEWAEAIVKAATSAGPAKDANALDALVAAPRLDPEVDEPRDVVKIPAGIGEIKMSQENEPSADPSSEATSPPTSVAPTASTSSPERKRSSLKAFAERASVRPVSIPPVSSPSAASSPASATSSPIPGKPSRPASTAPVSRPVEAGADDSGVVNLNIVKETATAQQIAAAEKAKPGTADLFEDDKPAEAAAAAAAPAGGKVIPITAAKAPEAKKSNGVVVGAVIALLGVAAAFGIVQMQSKPAPQQPAVSEIKPVVAEPKQAPTAAPETPAPSAVAAADPAATATAEPDKDAPKVAATSTGGPLPSGIPTVAAKDPAEKLAANTPAAKDAPAGKPGDLQSEMAKAVGAADQPKPKDGTPEPAAANPKAANIPEQPSQGSVQAAIGTVMGGAKACVAGADDVSRAQVTFASSGAVSNVSVTGWAAAHGKSGCVQAALKGAKVGPFSKPSFSVGVTIRP